jgi:hypothetical protein
MNIEVDAFLLDEEIYQWSLVRPGREQDLIDPRLIDWLRARNFDLNQPIKTERIQAQGRTRYSQARIVRGTVREMSANRSPS